MYQDIKYIFKRCGWLMLLFCVVMYTSLMYFNVYLIALFSFLVLLLVPFRKYVNKECLLLFSFSVLYCLNLWIDDGIESLFLLLTYFISPIAFYIFGSYVVNRLKSPKLISIFLLIFSIFFMANLYYCVIKDINENGYIDWLRSIDIVGRTMTGKSKHLSATLLGLNASLGFVGLSIFVYSRKNLSLLVRILFLVLCVLSILTVTHLINRTGLVVLVACFVCITIFMMKRHLWSVLAVVILGGIIAYFVYSFGWIDESILQAYEDRDVEGHSLKEGGGRIDRWLEGFEMLFSHPWGYSKISGTHYAHNLWLDVGRVAGFIPFIVLVLATVSYGVKFLKLLSKNDGFLCPIFLAYNVVFFLSCMVEPIMEGFPLYFYLYVMIWGMQNQYLKLLVTRKDVYL